MPQANALVGTGGLLSVIEHDNTTRGMTKIRQKSATDDLADQRLPASGNVGTAVWLHGAVVSSRR
jgi:hypothetical protein